MSANDIKKFLEETPTESPIIFSNFAEELPDQYLSIKYPLDALGSILGDAAKQLAYHVQVPEGIAAQSVLSAASLIAQAHINVQRGNIGIGPVSIFSLSVAESGDRKSTVDRLALAPIRFYENKRLLEMSDKEKRYKSELDSWTIRRNNLIKAYSNGNAEMSEAKHAELTEKLIHLEQIKPIAPPRPNITFSEPTAEGIWKHYIEGDPSAGLFSDEGISFFEGHGMNDESRGRTIHMLSKLWDGDTITRTRGAAGESGTLAQRRLSAHLMIQPVVAVKVLSDPLLQGQGFLARFLVCHEKSIAGSRLLAGRDLTKGAQNDPLIGKYWEKMTELLNIPVKTNPKTGELELAVSILFGDAFDAWCALHDGIEDNLKASGRFADVKTFASKAAEHAARIAAVLAFVEGYEHPLVEHVQRAGVLISYYLESMLVRTQEAQEDSDELLARDLIKWIKEHGGKLSASNFKKLPHQFRRSTVARKILSLLVTTGHLRVSENNIRTGKASAWEVVK
jgi:Protein of unknown function (DUF3987)